MGLLLYKSNEMFSSTELIRKSKTIFNKIINNEIEKAIVLRDGKPSFLLMDFEKYENIMAEFETLKEYVAKEKSKEKSPKKSKQKAKSKQKKKLTLIDENNNTTSKNNLKEELELEKSRIDTDIVSTDYEEITKEIHIEKEEEKIIDENIIEDEKEIVEELTEEEEISNALKSIESMNFDGDMKKMAEDKIKTKILQARRERAELLEKEEQIAQELAQEEQELQQQIQEEKVKKEQELKEFWD